MKARPVLLALAAGAFLLGACSGDADPDNGLSSTKAPTTTAQPPPFLDDPVQLAGVGVEASLREWHAMPERAGVVYHVAFDVDEPGMIRAVDAFGEPWDVAEVGQRFDGLHFSKDGATIYLLDRIEGEFRLRSVPVDGGETTELLRTAQPIELIDEGGADVLVAVGNKNGTMFATVARTGRIDRVLLELPAAQRARLGRGVVATGPYVVFMAGEGEARRIVSLHTQTGDVVEHPRFMESWSIQFLDTTSDGKVLLRESFDETTSSVWAFAADGSDEAELIAPDGGWREYRITEAALLYETYAGAAFEYTFATGETRPIDGMDPTLPPFEPIDGFSPRRNRVLGVTAAGQWLLIGKSADDPEHESWWQANAEPGRDLDRVWSTVQTRHLYAFDPETAVLARLSGEPHSSQTTTAVGTSFGPHELLEAEVLHGGQLVAYTTGFSGAAYDIPYDLYIASVR